MHLVPFVQQETSDTPLCWRALHLVWARLHAPMVYEGGAGQRILLQRHPWTPDKVLEPGLWKIWLEQTLWPSGKAVVRLLSLHLLPLTWNQQRWWIFCLLHWELHMYADQELCYMLMYLMKQRIESFGRLVNLVEWLQHLSITNPVL